MTALAFAFPRKRLADSTRPAAAPSTAGRWLAVLVVGLLLALFGLAARGGR
jgi:hypothetical protein